jgi:hypothetical protein
MKKFRIKYLLFITVHAPSTHPTSFQAETELPKTLLTLLMSSLLPTSGKMFLKKLKRKCDLKTTVLPVS